MFAHASSMSAFILDRGKHSGRKPFNFQAVAGLLATSPQGRRRSTMPSLYPLDSPWFVRAKELPGINLTVGNSLGQKLSEVGQRAACKKNRVLFA